MLPHTACTLGVLLLAADIAFGWWLTGRWSTRISTRRFAWTPLAMLLLFAADKAVYAWSDLTDYRPAVDREAMACGRARGKRPRNRALPPMSTPLRQQ